MSSGPVAITGKKLDYQLQFFQFFAVASCSYPQSGMFQKLVATGCNWFSEGYIEGT